MVLGALDLGQHCLSESLQTKEAARDLPVGACEKQSERQR